MITFKCKNCSGEMTIDGSGDLYCPYCGTKANFSDKELAGYKEFRSKMLQYLASVADSKEKSSDEDYLWQMAETIVFTTKDETDITIKYLYEGIDNGIKFYAAKGSVIYVFPQFKSVYADKMLKAINTITYPQADLKELNRCVPDYQGRYELKGGDIMLVFAKPDNMFPLPLFGNLPYEHVAWIVSRLENIACLLNYNDVCHGNITPDTIYINPKTHEASLMGGWWTLSSFTMLNKKDDLKCIRKTAKQLLGKSYSDIPKMFKEFIEGAPKEDAYKDFEYWDKVIEEGLGGRHFHVLNTNKIING